MGAELTKARLRGRYLTLEQWRNDFTTLGKDVVREDEKCTAAVGHPRWIRINTLRTSSHMEIASSFGHFKIGSMQSILSASSDLDLIAKDENIPDLVVVPRGIDLSRTLAYQQGRIIMQDKASCFPAYLLDPRAGDGDIIDACAAPGNKTTHLAALVHLRALESGKSKAEQTIFACERDAARSDTLRRMIHKAGADTDRLVHCLYKQDFLKLNPADSRFERVGALLLDPSCSGSGIVGRSDDDASAMSSLVLPQDHPQLGSEVKRQQWKGTKRKRPSTVPVSNQHLGTNAPHQPQQDSAAYDALSTAVTHKPLEERLQTLSVFQLALLGHAFAFNTAHKIVYSTCSVHAEENEYVVLQALGLAIARQRGWEVCKRRDQIDGMRRWETRGDFNAMQRFVAADQGNGADHWYQSQLKEIADACIRCERGTEKGTMGFFAVKFIRPPGGGRPQIMANTAEDEWEGFDEEGD